MSSSIKKLCIILPCILIVLFTLFFLMQQSSKIAQNPEGIVGNTAGNLQNEGLFCEEDGEVFFANPYDNYRIYTMRSDESDIHRISSSSVRYLNTAGKYLYYYQFDSADSSEYGFISNLSGIFRCSKNGGRTRSLKKTQLNNLILLDNTLYYLNYSNNDGFNLYSIDTDKSNDDRVLDGMIDPSCYANGYVYYCIQNSTENHHLMRYHLATHASEQVLDQDIWYPQIVGNYIFFLDIHNDYHLCRYDLSTQTSMELTDFRIDCYNAGNSFLYFQANSDTSPYLGYMYLDGSNLTTVSYGNYYHINQTSSYVYFQGFGEDISIYHSPLGTQFVESFTSAQNAAFKEN